MVKVEIVEEKDNGAAPSYVYGQNDSASVSEEEAESVNSDDEDDSSDSFIGRIFDFIPPSTRHSIATNYNNVSTFLRIAGRVGGTLVWVVTTSALLIGLPLALSLEDEARIVQQEKDMMAQQQGVQQVSVIA